MSTTTRSRFSNPRIVVLLIGSLAVLSLFVLRLWDLQIVRGDEFRGMADRNRFRLESIDALRGVIYDRNGVPLVHNAPSFEVQIIPAYLPDDPAAEQAVFQRLATLLKLPVESQPVKTSEVVPMDRGAISLAGTLNFMLNRLMEKVEVRGCCIKDIVDEVRSLIPYSPVTIKAGVERNVALHIAELASDLPGVRVHVASVREYISGTVMSNIIGYMRRISAIDLPTLPDTYDPSSDRIGAIGIEGQLEDVLRGQKGKQYVEEDVVGRQVRVVGQSDPGVPGQNVYLTIDFDLQKFAQQTLQDQIDTLNRTAERTVTQQGVVIASNPRTGEILAMVSLPTYDNNIFSSSYISQTMLDQLQNDPYLPQVNHAIQSVYPPGSTFKIVPASAALQEKLLTPKNKIYDPGAIIIPNKYFPDDLRQAQTFVCWLRSGHGEEDVVEAMAHSCDVFFYEIAGGLHGIKGLEDFDGLNVDRLGKYAELFGFGSPTGIDLIGEAAGFVPDPVWKRRATGENWSLGDTYNFGIGQGFLTATPLQTLNAMAAIANNGILMKPQVVKQVTDVNGRILKTFVPQAIRKIPVDFANIQIVQQGVDAAVNSEDGTAIKAQVPGLKIAGKTGTAEYCDDLAQKMGECYIGHVPTHASFTAYAPADDPQIAILVFIYNGGEGARAAVPVAQKILKYWFEHQPPAGQ